MRTFKTVLAVLLGLLLWASPVSAAIALVANVAGQTTGSCSGGDITTSSINTTGATLLVALAVTNSAATAPTDSNANSWVQVTAQTNAIFSQVYYVKNPTVGAGHTFSLSNVQLCAGLAVVAFSGTDTAANVDQSASANNAGSSTIQAGSITPTVNDEVVVAAIAGNGSTFSINGVYITTNLLNFVSGTAYAVGLAYSVQTTATATNPTWTLTGNTINHAHIASFKASAGGGATSHPCGARRLLGVGCEVDEP